MLALIAPKYFAGGESVLQSACLDISNWPSLQAGECIQLSLLGTLFQTYIPSLRSANLQQPYSSTPSAAINQIEDLKNLTPESPTTSLNEENKQMRDTNSMSEDDTSVKNDNISQTSDQTQPTSNNSIDSVQSREDILDSYKQSKEMLLAQQSKMHPQSPCDKNSSKTIGANNANDNDNDVVIGGGGGGDDGDADLDDYLDGNFSDKFDNTANTQIESSINIERPLQLTQQQSVAKTPIVLASVTEIDIFRSLYTVLSYTHLLWELVLTAEPIVVMATSPSDCSHMVQSLVR